MNSYLAELVAAAKVQTWRCEAEALARRRLFVCADRQRNENREDHDDPGH